MAILRCATMGPLLARSVGSTWEFSWRRLISLHVEPAFRALVVGAFLGAKTTDRDLLDHLQDILHRWITVLASPGRGRCFGADLT